MRASRWPQTTRAYRLLHKARERARDNMLPCTITEAHVEAVWPRDGRCPVLGIPLIGGRGFLHSGSPTLDRINPALGYIPGNIAVISHRANSAKRSLSVVEVEKLAAWMRMQTSLEQVTRTTGETVHG